MLIMDRAEHLAECKRVALELLDAGELSEAVASMGSDLAKHPETQPNRYLILLGMRYVIDHDAPAIRRWIEGFH
jgi:hypothetical protein